MSGLPARRRQVFSTASALRSIVFSSALDIRPAFTAWLARALALRACGLSSIGYARFPGSANFLAGSLLRAFVVSSAMATSLRWVASPTPAAPHRFTRARLAPPAAAAPGEARSGLHAPDR